MNLPYALIIVDMQNDFVLPGAPAVVAGAHATLPKIQEALAFWREKKWPVIYLYREYRRDGSDIEITRMETFLRNKKFCVPGTTGAQIVDDIAPREGDYLIMKNRFSGFMDTETDFILRRLHIERIAVCGTQYPCCVRATLVDGICYGYETVCLMDATSASTPEVSESNIFDLREMGVDCVDVAEFIKRSEQPLPTK